MSKVKYLHYDRHLGIGGSDANVIMKGEWKNLWEIKHKEKNQMIYQMCCQYR